MVIEWLKFKIPAEKREFFLKKDEEIWTPFSKKYRGFLGKEIWLNPNDLEELVIIVYWENRELWKSIPQEEIDQTEAKFNQVLNGIKYEIIESLEYQVRKSPHSYYS